VRRSDEGDGRLDVVTGSACFCNSPTTVNVLLNTCLP
jgi:hypothetical protein